jgi:hypothetical protein
MTGRVWLLSFDTSKEITVRYQELYDYPNRSGIPADFYGQAKIPVGSVATPIHGLFSATQARRISKFLTSPSQPKFLLNTSHNDMPSSHNSTENSINTKTPLSFNAGTLGKIKQSI